ncbi:endonuclease/exonuclease/phosphatase family protein [Litoribacterium kuwaitense]|uniref:endonuclease/exonuclease/phosphatase family protein n=1 Tax=Litoribacterium kuwaitense TaxID=1398745 RepID=UPI001FE262DB|nr:endonuclease/exonuclease/phosphatase family protein [Litoribacterium kuwaitense]
MNVRCMTFNLRHANENDPSPWSRRKDAIVDVIQAREPSLLGTQEMLPEMLKELTSALPDYEAIGAFRRDKDEANTLFVHRDHWQVDNHHTFWLSTTPEDPGSFDWGSIPRICTYAELTSKQHSDVRIRVMNTHLDHESPYARHQGALIIRQYFDELQQKEAMPTLLMGDMNEGLKGQAINVFQSLSTANGTFKSVFDQAITLEETFHHFGEFKEGDPIDFIFYSREWTWEKTEIVRDRPNGIYPSDHDPVLADFRLGE